MVILEITELGGSLLDLSIKHAVKVSTRYDPAGRHL